MPEEYDRDEQGQFSHGNTIWRLRSVFGAPRVFDDAQSLWESCCAYFEWATENPLFEARVLSDGIIIPVSKMRAFTQRALCLHLRISDETWRTWRKDRPDLRDVIHAVDDMIFTQKFEGAAAGLLNANLIARELGIAEKNEHTGKDGGPIAASSLSDFEVARRIAFALELGVRDSTKTQSEETS